MNQPNIHLSTLNARYIHASLGLRYLKANLGNLAEYTTIREFVINTRAQDIVEKILDDNPTIIGFGVYIWNIEDITKVVSMIKTVRPDITIVLGGPEVSYESENTELTNYADYVISGQADVLFRELCEQLVAGDTSLPKYISGPPPRISDLSMPYELYTKEDIDHRVLYVEASRGCPYKCEFCLSALDKTAWPFDIELFLQQMEKLYNRGARQFKFVDRTFNLKIDHSIRIMRFFLDRMSDDLFLHFEVIPDHLPDKLKSIIQEFPAGSLQFEIGVQSLNPDVQKLISRKQNNSKTLENLSWLLNETNVHIHSDLILGLPGEDLESIADGFDQLALLGPHEIQVGILKRLKGSPIIRHTDSYQMRFSPVPPYNILETSTLDFATMQRLGRFARYWDIVGNSGRFKNTLPLILGNYPFERFMKVSEFIFATSGQTHKISLARMFSYVYQALTEVLKEDERETKIRLASDFQVSGQKGIPSFLADVQMDKSSKQGVGNKSMSRQQRHLNS